MSEKKKAKPKAAQKSTAHHADKPAHARAHAEKTTTAAAAPVVPIDPDTGERDVSGASAFFTSLLTTLDGAGQKPSAEATKVWQGLITSEDAHRDGVSIGSDRILADALFEFAAHVPLLIEQPYPGYGPKRAYYALTLAKQLADTYQSVLQLEANQASASKVKQGNVKTAVRGRSLLHGVLGELAYGDPSLGAGIHRTVSKSKRTVHIAESVAGLGSLAKGVLDKSKSDAGLAEVLADMGLTSSVVDGAQAASGGVTSATTDHNAERVARAQQSDALNELDGRVWFELDALVRSGARARTHDGRSIPDVKLANIGRVQHRRTTTPAPSPPAQLDDLKRTDRKT